MVHENYKYLSDQGFQKSSSNSNLYIKTTNNDIILLIIYVDDLIINSNLVSLVQAIKQNLCQSFDVTNLGLVHYCLNVEVCQQSSGIFISQSKYVRALLDKFHTQDCKLTSTPMEKDLKLSTKSDSPPVDDTTYNQLVGSLIYLCYQT